MRKIPFILLCSIVGLAAFGLIFQLFSNPTQLITSILKTLLIAGVLIAIIYFLFFRSNKTHTSSKKYKQAVKQSQKKYGKQTQQPSKRSSKGSKRKTKRRASHLRVIEGNKSKKDDQASN